MLRPASLLKVARAAALAGWALAPAALSPASGAPAGPPSRQPQTYAVLINGGGSASRNYLSHLHHLQDLVAALRVRGLPADRIAVFSADGTDPGNDLLERDVPPADFWLIEDTPAGRALNPPRLTSTEWAGISLRPARLSDLRRWFQNLGTLLKPDDTLLVFVTDHGSRNPDDDGNGLLSLWGESLSVLEFRALLGYLQPGVRVVSVMSQCFSGAFADAMSPLNSPVPTGSVCGFYSAPADRPAYGCYPEGRDRDQIGYAFRFIQALGRHGALDDAHAATLIADTTPDVPLRTSDLFLERFLREQAALRRVPMEELADEQLELAWDYRGQWEPEIRLLDRIGEVYATFSPRLLSELAGPLDKLQAFSKDLSVYQDAWKKALDGLRAENLARFLDANPGWRERLDTKRIDALQPAPKKRLLADLLAALKAWTAGHEDVWKRLNELRATRQDASDAQFRTDVRLAALLRMRALLLRVAGMDLLREAAERDRDGGEPVREPSGSPGRDAPESSGRAGSSSARAAAYRKALEAMLECERTTIGAFDAMDERPPNEDPVDSLPPYSDDQAALRRALPSWIGLNFRPLTDDQLAGQRLARGAVVVENVYDPGPAASAGIRPGDVVLGPPGAHFTEPSELREWSMTAPRDVALPLDLLRSGQSQTVSVVLAAYPEKLPALPGPVRPGESAPLPQGLAMVREGPDGSALQSRRHLLYFWATWCGPCKAALPELMDMSRAKHIPVLAITDEEESAVRTFLSGWTGPFPEAVATDRSRATQIAYGVSGTPTFILVDEAGRVEWRQVGYSKGAGIRVPGWTWPGQ